MAEKIFGPASEELIRRWTERRYNGRYFRMFAVTDGGRAAGAVSLYEHSRSVVSLGVEILEDRRRSGLGLRGCELALEQARLLGYAVAMDQVRADNAASIGLHGKLGFENDGYVYKNRRGDNVLIFIKPLR